MNNTSVTNLIYDTERYLDNHKQTILVFACTEQHMNFARQNVIEEWGEGKLSWVNICLMQIVLISKKLYEDWSNFEISKFFPLYNLTNLDWGTISAICKKASTNDAAVGGGVAGAVTGFLFGGIIGAVVGGIGGAIQGDNLAGNNKERYYNVLREAISSYYEIVKKEMAREINIASRFINV